ncbi:BnaC06g24490D [Brassica napus]|uniref:BnaC06g24490D protein n=1 Tax=Brassica napus TaxID=3708 RepID=A0A078GAM6_BRANA|nr:BnaC06g24490D [Brassica napus]
MEKEGYVMCEKFEGRKNQES